MLCIYQLQQCIVYLIYIIYFHIYIEIYYIHYYHILTLSVSPIQYSFCTTVISYELYQLNWFLGRGVQRIVGYLGR